MEKLGFVCKCLGGGKIEHNSKDKKIRVFGLSTVKCCLHMLPKYDNLICILRLGCL